LDAKTRRKAGDGADLSFPCQRGQGAGARGVSALETVGFSPWLDEEEIFLGQDWNLEVEKVLETSDFVMVFLFERSVEKIGYVQREFRRAMHHAEEMPEGYIHTIPVKLDDCTVMGKSQ
jgi:hypothetical protein